MRAHLISLMALLATVSGTSCSGSMSHASACRQLDDTLNQLDATAKSVKDGTATTQDLAPDLKRESTRLHSIAIRTDGSLSSTAQTLSVIVARVRVDALTHRDGSADADALGHFTEQLNAECS